MMLAVALYSVLALTAPAQDPVPELVPVEIMEHGNQIVHLALGPKGKTLVTVEAPVMNKADKRSSCVMRAWDLKSEKQLWEASLTAPRIVDMGVGTDMIATNVGMGMFEEYKLKDGERVGGIGGPGATSTFLCIAVDPKDRWVWMGSKQGGLVRLTPGNVNGWSKRGVDNGGTYSLAMDSKGKQLAIGGKDGSVRFANPVGAQVDEKKVFEVHKKAVTALTYDSKGRKLVVGSKGGELCMLEASKGKRTFDLSGHEDEIRSVAVDPKREWIASGDKDGVVLLWNYKGGEPAAKLMGEAEGPVADLLFIDKGKRLIGTRGGNRILVWDLSDL